MMNAELEPLPLDLPTQLVQTAEEIRKHVKIDSREAIESEIGIPIPSLDWQITSSSLIRYYELVDKIVQKNLRMNPGGLPNNDWKNLNSIFHKVEYGFLVETLRESYSWLTKKDPSDGDETKPFTHDELDNSIRALLFAPNITPKELFRVENIPLIHDYLAKIARHSTFEQWPLISVMSFYSFCFASNWTALNVTQFGLSKGSDYILAAVAKNKFIRDPQRVVSSGRRLIGKLYGKSSDENKSIITAGLLDSAHVMGSLLHRLSANPDVVLIAEAKNYKNYPRFVELVNEGSFSRLNDDQKNLVKNTILIMLKQDNIVSSLPHFFLSFAAKADNSPEFRIIIKTILQRVLKENVLIKNLDSDTNNTLYPDEELIRRTPNSLEFIPYHTHMNQLFPGLKLDQDNSAEHALNNFNDPRVRDYITRFIRHKIMIQNIH